MLDKMFKGYGRKIKDTRVHEEEKKFRCDSCGDEIDRRGIIKVYAQHPSRVYSSGLPCRMNYKISLCKKKECWERINKSVLDIILSN